MTITASPLVEALLAAVKEMEPLLRAYADEAERESRLPAPVVEAMRDAGLFRMFRPAARGGLGLDPVSEFRVAEAIARVDSAAAWNLQVCNAGELYGGWFSDAVSDDVFGPSESIVAGAFNPHRRAIPVEGGYRVSGRTPFTSNCQGATWIMGLADIYDGDTMRLDAAGEPTVLLTMCPAEEVDVVENWNTMGMRGTGSHDVDMQDAFVPTERAVPFAPLARPSSAYDTPLAGMTVWATVGCHASVALGVAQAAIDDLIGLGMKVPAYTKNALRDRALVQTKLAHAEGALGAARAYFHQVYDEAWATLSQGDAMTMQQKARCQLASTHAAQASAQAVDLVHACVGATGIRNEANFQRYFRDAHVITQHAFISEGRLTAVGQVFFGLEPDWPFFAF